MLTESRIQDRNAINTAANEIQGHMLRLLSPWQGKKIRKISGHGGNVAKLQAEFDRYCQDHGYNQAGQHLWVCMTASYTSLIVTIRDTARPISTELYVAQFDDETGILTALGDGDKRRTDYTLAEVEQALNRAQVLEAEARELRHVVNLFIKR
jgi:hypothetical protein